MAPPTQRMANSLTGAIATSLASTAIAAIPATPVSPVRWVSHSEVDYLDNLPHRYGCEALAQKFRGVLLSVGARPDMQISAYGCGGRPYRQDRATHVDIHYAVPELLPQNLNLDSPTQAVPSTIRLRPGMPKSLDPGDCVLLEDMRQTVLSSFAKAFKPEQIHCGSSMSAPSDFALDVQALVAVTRHGK